MNAQEQRDKIVELLGTPDDEVWPGFRGFEGVGLLYIHTCTHMQTYTPPRMRQVWRGFGQLPGAKLVRYKKKQSTLRDKFPSHSYTGDPTLSDKGFELLKGLLCYDPARRMTVPKL